jgi:hypothetical protein
MPVWAWVLIAAAVVIAIAAVVVALLSRRRSAQLRGTFGQEYDRTVEGSSSKRQAEEELSERERRRAELDIRPLDPAARERYAERWQQASADFVDAPATAVAQADALIVEVMRERGYPMDDFEQRASDISVDHPDVVGRYREGHRISELSARGEASTDDLRHAIQHYRELFNELLEPPADEPTAAERSGAAEGQTTSR